MILVGSCSLKGIFDGESLIFLGQSESNIRKFPNVDAAMLKSIKSPGVRSWGSEPSPNGSPDPGRGSSLPEKVAACSVAPKT
jgi:hypothetical protein